MKDKQLMSLLAGDGKKVLFGDITVTRGGISPEHGFRVCKGLKEFRANTVEMVLAIVEALEAAVSSDVLLIAGPDGFFSSRDEYCLNPFKPGKGTFVYHGDYVDAVIKHNNLDVLARGERQYSFPEGRCAVLLLNTPV